MVEINFTIILQVINFLILVFVLKRLFWEPMMRHLDRRDALLEGRSQETAKLTSEAEEMMQRHKAHLSAARRDGTKLKEELVTKGRVERTRLLDEATKEIARAVAQGEERLQQEMLVAVQSVPDKEIDRFADTVVDKLTGLGGERV